MEGTKLFAAFLLATAVAIPTAGVGGDTRVPNTFLHGLPSAQAPIQSELSSLEGAREWLNSPPLTPSALRGKSCLTYFHEVDKGGHFAAWEEPELFSAELRAAFRPLRESK
jgi:pimeloyl-ACP methyl ester carboxylesterase